MDDAHSPKPRSPRNLPHSSRLIACLPLSAPTWPATCFQSALRGASFWAVGSVQLKDVLDEIQSDGAHRVHGRLLEWPAAPSLWHTEAVGGVHMGSSRERVAPSFRQRRSRRGADCCSSDHDGVARPSRDRAGLGAGDRRMKMAEYVGLDVSMKETAVSIRRDGKRIWRGKCGSDPRLIAEVIRRRAPGAARVVFETGPLRDRALV